MMFTRLFVWAFAAMVMAPQAFAAEKSDGTVSITLTKQLYCGATSLLQGNIGLIIGLIFVATAVWSLMKGGKWVPALILMASGALITALPSLINSFFTGYGDMLKASGIGTVYFDKIGCTLTEGQAIDAINKANKGSWIEDEMNKALGIEDTGTASGSPYLN